MKKLFYALVLSIIGIMSFNMYPKSSASKQPKWICKWLGGHKVYYNSKEEAATDCLKHFDAKVKPIEIPKEHY